MIYFNIEMQSHKFEVIRTCPRSGARAGILTTPHGIVPTPAFIPVGSQGTVKSLTPEELESLGVKILLGNTYHLYLRPGVEIIEKLGGLHRFISWEGTIVTDSGGYQLFSLASLRRISEEGVLFRSHIDGSQHFFTPESIIEFQERLGADIILPLDECPPYCAEKETVRESMLRTHRWAERCQRSHKKETQALYAIVQGGIFPELRRESAQFLTSLGFCGYALGGLSLGEPREKMLAVVEETVAYLPGDKPRYLLGVGSPEELVEAISRGIDLFDSALPTRVARNGALFTAQGRRNIRNASFRTWEGPVDIDCDCYTCRHFSAAYLHHLFRCEELLAYRLATFHNLHFIIRLMERARRSIEEGEFPRFKRDFLDGYQSTDEETRLNQKRKWLESSRKGEKRNYEIDV